MAQHGFGRGGRGYSFLSQKEEKPGISSSSEDEAAISLPADFRNLLLGRGRSGLLGRGLPPSDKPGRGFMLGLSGSMLGRGQTKMQTGQMIKPGVSSAVDSNDNILHEETQSEQSLESKATSSIPPPCSSPDKTHQIQEQRRESPTGAIPKHPFPHFGITGRGRGLQKIYEESEVKKLSVPSVTAQTEEKLAPAKKEATALSKPPQRTSIEDIKVLLGSKDRGLPANFGRGSSTVGRGFSFLSGKSEVEDLGMRQVSPEKEIVEAPQGRHLSHGRGKAIHGQTAPLSREEMIAGIGGVLKPSEQLQPQGRGTRLKFLHTKPAVAEDEKSFQPSSVQKPAVPEFIQRKPKTEGLQIQEKVVSPTKEGAARSLKDFPVFKRDVVEYRGSSGAQVPIQVNCVRIKCRNEAVYQYHVSFDPPIDNRNMRYSLLNQHRDVIGTTKAFDGAILYLPIPLSQPETILLSKRITDDTEIRLKISLTRALPPTSHLLLSFYNVVLHRCMKILKMCPVGRNYYDPANAQAVPKYKLHLWPGYVTAIREMEGGLLLNIDTSHKVLRNETVLSLMQDIYHHRKENFHAQCIKELVGSTVLTRYNNNNYRVDDIDWNMTPKSTFTTSGGETISFFDYYKAQYRIEIKDLNQPMLINRPKKATQRSKRVEEGEERVLSLVPELCFLTGLSERLAGDFTAMKEIGNFTRLGPKDRRMQIEMFLQRINQSQEARQELLRWGLEMDTSILDIEGRSFPPEKVLVGRNHIFTCNEEVDFFRDISRNSVIRAVPINHWIMVFTSRDQSKARDFVQKFVEVSGKLGMQLRPPKYIELKDDRSDSFKHAISSAVNPSLQLVVCIFPTARDDRYSAVKRLCCVDMPVPSQVILSKTLPRDPSQGKFRSVTMKIALQINCKLGGELWALDIPLSGLMVCGIDVFHEGKQGKGKSVASLVASMNKLMTRWFSRAVIQLPQQEIIDSLKHCFCDTLRKYYEVNHKLPERIIIYRDGVGDGRLPMVAEHEVVQLRESLKMFNDVAGGSYDPKLTIVVVSKRVNIKYFRVSGKQLINPPPGTVIDHTVTRPNWPDFYLVSQHVRQGTVSPTHYVVIHGDMHLKSDHLQRLTYKMTHMYYNWPGTVRVPAPCQYAHKMAYLVGENIKKEPALDLCDRLFYL